MFWVWWSYSLFEQVRLKRKKTMFIHTNQPLITSFYIKNVPIFCWISDESALIRNFCATGKWGGKTIRHVRVKFCYIKSLANANIREFFRSFSKEQRLLNSGSLSEETKQKTLWYRGLQVVNLFNHYTLSDYLLQNIIDFTPIKVKKFDISTEFVYTFIWKFSGKKIGLEWKSSFCTTKRTLDKIYGFKLWNVFRKLSLNIGCQILVMCFRFRMINLLIIMGSCKGLSYIIVTQLKLGIM